MSTTACEHGDERAPQSARGSAARPDGPPGFGAPDFGGPRFGPGQFVAQAFLREARTDKNGAVSLQEFKTLAGRWWEAWDTNRNGSLDIEELSAGIALVVEGPPGMGGPMGGTSGPSGGGPAAVVGQKIFSTCDANNDDKLTREEMVGGFEKLYRQWDVDSKGSLDASKIGSGLDQLMGPPPMY